MYLLRNLTTLSLLSLFCFVSTQEIRAAEASDLKSFDSPSSPKGLGLSIPTTPSSADLFASENSFPCPTPPPFFATDSFDCDGLEPLAAPLSSQGPLTSSPRSSPQAVQDGRRKALQKSKNQALRRRTLAILRGQVRCFDPRAHQGVFGIHSFFSRYLYSCNAYTWEKFYTDILSQYPSFNPLQDLPSLVRTLALETAHMTTEASQEWYQLKTEIEGHCSVSYSLRRRQGYEIVAANLAQDLAVLQEKNVKVTRGTKAAQSLIQTKLAVAKRLVEVEEIMDLPFSREEQALKERKRLETLHWTRAKRRILNSLEADPASTPFLGPVILASGQDLPFPRVARFSVRCASLTWDWVVRPMLFFPLRVTWYFIEKALDGAIDPASDFQRDDEDWRKKYQ